MTVGRGRRGGDQDLPRRRKGRQAFVMALGMSMWCAYEGVIAPERVLDADRPVPQRRHAPVLSRRQPRHGGSAPGVGAVRPRARPPHATSRSASTCTISRAPALANVLAALDAGAAFVEGAICGIGGGIAMPKTIASVGNLATEDIVHMLNEMGVDDGRRDGRDRGGGTRHRQVARHRAPAATRPTSAPVPTSWREPRQRRASIRREGTE